MKNGLSQLAGLVVQFGRSRPAVELKAFESRAERSREELVESRDILSSDQFIKFINALGLTRQALRALKRGKFDEVKKAATAFAER